MLQSLETQLTDGPLADLSAAALTATASCHEVQSLESSYEQGLDQQLLPEFLHVDEILKLQGQAIVADVISLNQQDRRRADLELRSGRGRPGRDRRRRPMARSSRSTRRRRAIPRRRRRSSRISTALAQSLSSSATRHH